MKIIKHGDTVKELTCPDCGCIFLAGEIDICRVENQDEYWADGTAISNTIIYVDQFVSCPECGADCRVEEQNEKDSRIV